MHCIICGIAESHLGASLVGFPTFVFAPSTLHVTYECWTRIYSQIFNFVSDMVLPAASKDASKFVELL